MPRIFLVDDHPVMRRGYRHLLEREPDLEVCGEAGGADEALARIPDAHPDLAVVDLSLGEGPGGLDLVKRLRTLAPQTTCLVVSMHDEGLYAERALQAGAGGYLMKSEVDQTVVAAIREILRGGVYVSAAVRNRLLAGQLTGAPPARRSLLDLLSDRELEIYEQLGRGRTTREVADALHISPKTVETHRGRIKQKLGVTTTAELVQRAVLWVEGQEA